MKKLLAMLLALAMLAGFAGCTAAQAAEVPEAVMQKNAPEGKKTGVSYRAEPNPITDEEINAFLSRQGVTAQNVSTQEISGSIMTKGVCSNGNQYLRVQGKTEKLEDFQYITGDFELYNQYPIYYGEWGFRTNSRYTVGWMFEEPKELSFCTVQKAEQEVRKAFEALGLTDLQLLRTLYLDQETLQKANEYVAANPDFESLKEPGKPFNGYPLREWSREDEAYVFSFGLKQDGLPVSAFSSRSGYANDPGAEIYAWYNRNGIVYLRANEVSQKTEPLGEPEKLCSSQEALEEAKKLAGDWAAAESFELQKPALEYVLFQENGESCMKPVWTVPVQYPGGFVRVLFIDAVTGKEA